MIVEDSTTQLAITQIEHTSYRMPVILGTIITLTAVTLPLLFIFVVREKPTGSLLSPIPSGEVAETLIPTTTPEFAVESPIIAAPEESSTNSGEAKSAANAPKTMITLPAGKNEIVVRDEAVTADSYIYIVPISQTNDPVYVKTKDEGYFIIRTNKASDADLLLDYYIVNE